MIYASIDLWTLERSKFEHIDVKKLVPKTDTAAAKEQIYRREVFILEMSRKIVSPTGFSTEHGTERSSFSFFVGGGRTGFIIGNRAYQCLDDDVVRSGGPEGEYLQRQLWVYEGDPWLYKETTIGETEPT